MQFRHKQSKRVSDDPTLADDPRWDPLSEGPAEKEVVADDLTDLNRVDLFAVIEAEGHDIDKRLRHLDKIRDAIRLARTQES